MDRIRARNRKRKGVPDDVNSEDEDDKFYKPISDLDEYLRQAKEIIGDQSLLIARHQEMLTQDKNLNDQLMLRTQRREQNKALSFVSILEQPSPPCWLLELEELLRKAELLIGESDSLNHRQGEISEQQKLLLEKIKLRKLKRLAEIEDDGGQQDPDKEKSYLEDLDLLMS